MNKPLEQLFSGKKSFNIILILCVIIVSAFLMLGILLHRSQGSLQQMRQEQFRNDSEKVASAFKGYFAERKRDLRTLASAQAFSSYFHNKALGISLDYGMRAIIWNIEVVLKRFIMEYKVEDEFFFSEVAFIDYKYRMRIRVLSNKNAEPPISIKTITEKQLIPPSTPLTLEQSGDNPELRISIPYFIMGKHVGELSATLSSTAIEKYLQLLQNSDSFNLVLLYNNILFAHTTSPDLQFSINKLSEVPPNTLLQLDTAAHINDTLVPMTARLMPIIQRKIVAISFIESEKLNRGQLPDGIMLIFYAIFLAAAASITFAAHMIVKNTSLARSLKEAADSKKSTAEHLATLQQEIIVRRNAEMHALTAQQKAEQLTHVVPSAVFTITMDRKIDSWNKRAEELTGYRAIEMIGQTCSSLFLDTCKDECALFPYKQKTTCGNQHTLRQKNGSLRTIIKNTEPMLDGFGQIIGLIECFEDITDQQKTLAALAKTEANYRDIIQNAQDGIFQSTLSGEILNANPAFLNIFEFNTVEEMRRSFRGFENHFYVCSTRRAEFVNAMLKNRFVTNFESQIRTNSGRLLWVLESARLRTAPDGSIRFEGFVRDITVQKEAEQNLIAAKEAAEAASTAKNNFLANISHELRTPMNAIIGISELGLRSETDPTRKRNMEVLYRASSSLLNLLNDLLDFSAIEANVLSLKSAPFSVPEIMCNIRDLMRGEARKKNLEFTVTTDPFFPPLVVSDKERVKQILVNLIWNAIKFTNAGAISVHCYASPLESGEVETQSHHTSTIAQEKVLLTCSVSDTGIGIPSDKLEEIFESFAQLQSFDAAPHGGIGLGLAISQRLALRMGGTITVKSTLNQGSTFTVQIPCSIPSDNADQPHLLFAESQDTISSMPPLNVLVAEDNVFSQEVLIQMLKEDGHTVFLAEHGEQVLEILSHTSVDIILMDVQMPVLDGLETTKRIRAGEVPNLDVTIPIVTISAHDPITSTDSFHNGEVTEWLQKPITLHALQQVLRSIFTPKHHIAVDTHDSELLKDQDFTTAMHIDFDVIIEMVNGKHKIVGTILRTYLSSLPATLELLQIACNEADAEKIASITHTLKATMGSVGAVALAQTAQQMEHFARNNNIYEAQNLLADFMEGAQQSMEEVTDYLAQNTRACS
ncbi:PAS domain-containing hybrid sensor histidine kinase/response regulator [Halodesulfovibrio sp.]|jgi:PAS domain S-box-containing protein|uniref:PAS domain-containing hybrid sensor histidine kinase/response regulator n=1 Tax=Halodesulfovibrio sp. TaxID=1912772 RepID=UPI0025D536BF|nr:PAS domain-containing hybrid sensor histidine kinase/response regulator [Halodesulfovibrio sp.]MCT4628114.1 PAS domain S-box protein [Halodesulfovibrio sp.]